MKRLVTLLLVCFSASVSAIQAATVNVGSNFTETNPYTVTTGTGDSYVFSDGGWMKANVGYATFSGTFSGNGTLSVTSAVARPQVYFNASLAGFSGTIKIDGSTWFGMNTTAARGSENATWVVNTTESDVTGLLLGNSLASTEANPVKLGKLEGNGCVRPMGNGGNLMEYVQVGNLLTNASDTSIYSGIIRLHNNDDVHVEKVGAGKWILTGANTFTGGLVVSEGTLQLGNKTTTGSIEGKNTITVKEGASFGYALISTGADQTKLYPVNKITVQNGTIFNGGALAVQYDGVTFENGGTITYSDSSAASMTFNNLNYTGDENSRLTIWCDQKATYLTGTLTSSGTGAKEIYLTGSRGNFLYLQCDLSQFTGTITAGPATNGTNGTWISLNAAKDAHNVTFNLMPGKNLDAGLLLDYTPAADSVLKIGALSGNGIVRANQWNSTYALQIGGNNEDAVFSGGIQLYNNSNYTVEKIGTGTWTITSDNTKYAAYVTGYKNNYTGDTTITGGTIQLGDYDPVTKTGGATGQLGGDDGNNSSKLTKIVISSAGTLAVARNSLTDVFNNIVSNDGTISVVNPDWNNHVALRGAVSGHIIKTGAGALAMGSDNGSNLTKITIQEGALKNWGASRLGNGATEIEFTGGTFLESTANETLANKFTFTGTGTLQVDVDYTISGVLSGAGNITKTGTGTLYLTGGSNYTGRLTVETGTVQVGKNTASYINNGSTLTVKKDGAFGYNRLYDAATVNVLTPITDEGGTLFNSGARAIHFNNVTFSSLGGTLKNTGTGLLTVSTVVTNSGVIKFNGTTNNDIVLNINTSAAAQSLGGLQSLTNVNSVLNFTSTNRANFLNLTGAMDTFRGTINVTGNCWFAFNSGTALGSELAVWNTTMTNNSGILFENSGLNGKTVKMGDLTGNGWVRTGNLANPNIGTVTIEVGALGNDSTFSGALRGNQPGSNYQYLNVVKVGDGTWTLASDGQVTGVDYNSNADLTVKEGTVVLNRAVGQASARNLTIAGGNLIVSNSNQTITGALTFTSGILEVADGATFTRNVSISGDDAATLAQMSGHIAGNTVAAQGIFSPGSTQSNIGTVTNDGDFTFKSGTTYLVNALNGVNDRLVVNGTLILEEGMKIAFSTEPPPTLDYLTLEIAEADDYLVAGVIPDISFNWDVLLADPQHWTLSMIDGVLVAQNKLPEPAAWVLLVLGSVGIFRVSRRRNANAAAC